MGTKENKYLATAVMAQRNCTVHTSQTPKKTLVRKTDDESGFTAAHNGTVLYSVQRVQIVF